MVVPPPVPPPVDPGPPDDLPVAFRDDVPVWLYGVEDEEEDEDNVDESELDGDGVVDIGVTSGSDPTVWDPLDID